MSLQPNPDQRKIIPFSSMAKQNLLRKRLETSKQQTANSKQQIANSKLRQ